MFQSFLGLEMEAAYFKSDPRGRVSQMCICIRPNPHCRGSVHPAVPSPPPARQPTTRQRGQLGPVQALAEALERAQLPGVRMSVARKGTPAGFVTGPRRLKRVDGSKKGSDIRGLW